MLLVGIVLFMLIAIAIGKRSQEFGLRQYIILLLLVIAQVCVALIVAFTKQRPPLL